MGQAKTRVKQTVAVGIPTIPPREDLVGRAIASARNQTLLPDAIHVVVDQEGRGAGPTRNKIWQDATTDWIAWLDDDDELLPDHLEFCLSVAKRTHADLVYPWFQLVDWEEATPERPDPLATVCGGQLVHPLGIEFGPEQARHLRRHAFIPATVVVKRSMLERVGGYPDHNSEEYERFNGCKNWALLVRLLDAGAKFAHAPKRTWRCYLGGIAGKSWKDQ